MYYGQPIAKVIGVLTSALHALIDHTGIPGVGGSGVSAHNDLTGVTANQHHAQLHAAQHATGQPDAITPANIGLAACGFNVVIDGGGAVIGTGVKARVEMEFAMTVTGWTIFADQSGSIVVDVWKDSLANYPPTVADSIAGSEKPTLSSDDINQDLALTTWTTALAIGDILFFNVDSVATVTQVTIGIRGTRA